MQCDIVFLDGPSASGKSTFKNKLLSDAELSFVYVKRYTTRRKRSDDDTNQDYIFVSHQVFENLIRDQLLVEYRHFKFGMSYGIGKEEVAKILENGAHVLGLMNLGAVGMVRNALPQARCILIDTPLEQIEHRLRLRKHHSEEEIEERLQNARTVKDVAHQYDFVCRNLEGGFEDAYDELKAFIVKGRK